MRQDIILVANKGEVIPTVLGEKVTKELTSCMGLAYIDPKEGLFAGSESAGLTLKDFEGHQEDFKESIRVYHFARADVKELNNDDLQPFCVLQQDSEKVVVAFVEGKFDVENDGRLTDAAVLTSTVLKDLLEDAWEIVQQDVEKLEVRMKGKSFAGEMERLCKPFKSSIVFMLSNGNVVTYSKNETKAFAPWGFTSSMLGLKEGVFPAPEAAPVEEPKRKIGGIKPSSEPDVPVGDPAPKDPAVTRVGNTAVIRKDSAEQTIVAAQYGQPEMVWVTPQNGMAEHKLHDWYHKLNNGLVPTNIKDRPAIQMTAEKAKKMGSVRIVGKVGEVGGTFKTFSDAAPEIKPVEPKPAVIPMQPSGPTEIIPAYPVDETKKIDVLIQNNKIVRDPADLKKEEDAYPTFWKAHGISAEKTVYWPLALRKQIAEISPLQAAHAWQNSDYQRKLISDELLEQMEENEALKKELAELKASTVAAEPLKKKIGGIRR